MPKTTYMPKKMRKLYVPLPVYPVSPANHMPQPYNSQQSAYVYVHAQTTSHEAMKKKQEPTTGHSLQSAYAKAT